VVLSFKDVIMVKIGKTGYKIRKNEGKTTSKKYLKLIKKSVDFPEGEAILS